MSSRPRTPGRSVHLTTGTFFWTVDQDVTSRISKTRCDTDGRKLTEQRRYAPTSVHVRRNQCSRSPESVFASASSVHHDGGAHGASRLMRPAFSLGSTYRLAYRLEQLRLAPVLVAVSLWRIPVPAVHDASGPCHWAHPHPVPEQTVPFRVFEHHGTVTRGRRHMDPRPLSRYRYRFRRPWAHTCLVHSVFPWRPRPSGRGGNGIATPVACADGSPRSARAGIASCRFPSCAG